MEKKKRRRVNNMEEARKELKVEEIKEKPAKEIKKEELKVRDYTDIARELTGLVKENYLRGFQLGLSLWEGNLKIINNQIDQWATVQEGYTMLMRELTERFPIEPVNFFGSNSKFANNQVERIIALQKDYFSVLMSTLDRFMKESFVLTRNDIDRAFSSFDDYISLIRG